MNLKMTCQHCSESKEVECETTHSALVRCEIAKSNGWTAILSNLSVPLYFCSGSCEFKYRVQKKTHLVIVGSVTR